MIGILCVIYLSGLFFLLGVAFLVDRKPDDDSARMVFICICWPLVVPWVAIERHFTGHYWNLPRWIPIWLRRIILDFEPVDYLSDELFIVNCKTLAFAEDEDDNWHSVAYGVIVAAYEGGVSPGLYAQKLVQRRR